MAARSPIHFRQAPWILDACGVADEASRQKVFTRSTRRLPSIANWGAWKPGEAIGRNDSSMAHRVDSTTSLSIC